MCKSPNFQIKFWKLATRPIFRVKFWELATRPIFRVKFWKLATHPIFRVKFWKLATHPIRSINIHFSHTFTRAAHLQLFAKSFVSLPLQIQTTYEADHLQISVNSTKPTNTYEATSGKNLEDHGELSDLVLMVFSRFSSTSLTRPCGEAKKIGAWG